MTIDFILSQISSWLGWLVAGIGGLVVIFFQRWRTRRLQDRLEQQDRVISTYKAKDEIAKQDMETDASAYSQINDLRDRVDNAESPEKAAGEVSNAINGYFGGKK